MEVTWDEDFISRWNSFRSKTGAILEEIQGYIEQFDGTLDLELVRFSDYEHQIVDGRPFDQYNTGMQELVRKLESADGYIFATPIFQGSIQAS